VTLRHSLTGKKLVPDGFVWPARLREFRAALCIGIFRHLSSRRGRRHRKTMRRRPRSRVEGNESRRDEEEEEGEEGWGGGREGRRTREESRGIKDVLRAPCARR